MRHPAAIFPILWALLNPLLSSGTVPTDSLVPHELSEVVITARRPAASVRADKISYTPSAMIAGSQGNIYDAIRSIPGVTIRPDGRIELYGIQSLEVYIDGRKSILSGDELINYLKALSATDIERIDVSSNLGARAEGSGTVAALNLIRARRKAEGYAAGTTLDGQLYKARQLYASAFAEYNTGQHNLAVNYSAYAARNPSLLLTDRPYLDSPERLTQVYERLRTDAMQHAAMSYEYRPSQALVCGTWLHYNYFRRNEPAVMTTEIPFTVGPTVTTNHARFLTHSVYGDFFVKRDMAPTQSHWTAACNFFQIRNSESQLMEDNTGLSVGGVVKDRTRGLVGSFDFARSLTEHWQMSAGARLSYVALNSAGHYSGQVPAANLGSSFAYSENVDALYLEGKASYVGVQATAGLRAEMSFLRSDFSGNESAEAGVVSRRYCHLYPSLSLTARTPGAGSWAVAYTSRVHRPQFSDLDPFIHLFDDITHVGGNISLKESVTHSLDLAWSNERWLRVALSAEHTADDIVKCYRELTERIVYVTPENLPRHLQLVLSLAGFNIRLSPRWHFSATTALLYSYYNFPAKMELCPNVLFTPALELQTVVRLPLGILAEAGASYRGPTVYGQARVSPVLNTHLTLKRAFLADRLAVSLYARDLFNTNHFVSTIYLAGRQASLDEKEYEDMRKIGLSVSYRISGGNRKGRKERRDSWIYELNRVNL